MRGVFHRFMNSPFWRRASADPFGIRRLAEVEVEIRMRERERLVAAVKADVLRELEKGK